MEHITVLKKEAVDLLALRPDSVVVDATYGAGGHAKEICARLSKAGTYIGIDADATAFVDSFLYTEKSGPKFHLINSNFSELTEQLRSLNITKVDAILADLGWRTDQFVSGGKGFSFTSDDPLLMTYGNPSQYLFTATDIVNGWAEEDIANVIYGYGEERYSRRIARAIVDARKIAPIESAAVLAQIVASALPGVAKSGKTNPATKTFQALRIAVNDELKVLETFLDDATSLLAPGGILAIISFHSLEDRQVKLTFKELAEAGHFSLLTKKPITASFDELAQNPRSRSAKLRGLKKIIDVDS
jgi:16S rRNA (cytosine1402-N4)-methyltransferase